MESIALYDNGIMKNSPETAAAGPAAGVQKKLSKMIFIVIFLLYLLSE